jgi:hypothetical protein
VRLEKGEWFMWNLGQQLPDRVDVYRESVQNAVFVREISRGTALALIRWGKRNPRGIFYSYRVGSGPWIDVRVCGDVDAWYGTNLNQLTMFE